MNHIKRTKSQESSNAIERMYITMRHLFNRGFYKPMGVSGKTLREALLTLRPEIYGSIAEDKSELNGLLYVIDRLPEGIAECQFIQLTAEEGLSNSHFKAIIPSKRRRNCFRIDKNQMNEFLLSRLLGKLEAGLGISRPSRPCSSCAFISARRLRNLVISCSCSLQKLIGISKKKIIFLN